MSHELHAEDICACIVTALSLGFIVGCAFGNLTDAQVGIRIAAVGAFDILGLAICALVSSLRDRWNHSRESV